jgi:DNA-directed RNA polymerase specialized sigma24 family protein
LSDEELLRLTPKRPAAFDVFYYDVIAARMRCSELVARKRVSRGLATLRDVLEER